MDTIIENLSKIIINYKKSESRGYLPATITAKLEEIEKLRTEFNNILQKVERTNEIEKKNSPVQKPLQDS